MAFSWLNQPPKPTDLALFSPDRKHFLIHTRHGDVKSNANVDSILLFETDAVVRYWNQRDSNEPPAAQILGEFRAERDEESLSDVRWTNNGAIAFIALADNGHLQAFSEDIRSRVVSQLTYSDTNVVSFSVSGSTVVYYACKREPDQVKQVVRVETFADALPQIPVGDRCFVTTPLEVFVGNGSPAGARRISLPAMRLGPDARRIWVSPSGKSAVVLAPATDAPPQWAEYRLPDPERWGFGPEWVRTDATSFDLINRYRYLYVSLRDNTARPLLDAPSGLISFNETPPEVFWIDDEHSVIVSNTFLPIRGNGGRELERRKRYPAIAEVNLDSGNSTAILWEPAPRNLREIGKTEYLIGSVKWAATNQILSIEIRRPKGNGVSEREFRRTPKGWEEVSISGGIAGEEVVVVRQHQALNERPRIYVDAGKVGNRVSHGSTRKSKMLYDPNPQADHVRFAAATEYTWDDSNGIHWTGGLLLPPDYVAGRRYPLVVQTHGFERNSFLLDGPIYEGQGASAFAAQAFSNAGFVVLQIEDNRDALTLDAREGELFAEGYKAAIDKLISSGMVDQSKVGLVAFSRTGWPALHMLAKWPELLAAVSISDALLIGYCAYNYNIGTASADDLAKLLGNVPSPGDLGDWARRDPLYRINRARAAIRLEEMGSGLGMWEAYALLKAAHKPVEFVVFPDGSHVLQKPVERLASQGGSIDWFRFWLQGYEDPDPGKREQFDRWRRFEPSAP